MHHPVGHAVLSQQDIQRRGELGRIIDVSTERHRALELLRAHERRGLPGHIEAENLGADLVEFGGDGRAQITSPAGDPDFLALE